jgi:ABC-type multidrug transport system ATPase subunit
MPNWRAEAGSLWVFLGPVGSFKSSVLEMVAGHSAIAAGASVSFGGTMSYMPQAAWILQATIRENIVCNETWNESRFNAILHACALEHDVKAMPKGIDTVVAEKGLNLSGGQKQRLALARAAYRHADIYVLDNPVSAIDDHTQQHIWTHLIEGLLCDATVIVASSRCVISCTAIVHMSTNGVVGDPEYVSGWCSATHANDVTPQRYSKPRAHTHEFRSSVAEAPVMSRSSASSVVDAAVCDVRREVSEYEAHASKIEADTGSNSKRIELQHSYASSVGDRGTSCPSITTLL